MNRDQLYITLFNMLSTSSPHPSERAIMEPYLPKGGTWDKSDNYIYVIPGDEKTIFAAHLDTVGGKPKHTEPIYHEHFLYASNPDAACLGGDDRNGVLCLLALIDAGVPGTYIFHNCEERGAVGASYIEKTMDLKKFERAIEFDRRATTSIITEMSGNKVCSPEFTAALAGHLGMGFKADPTGSFTDVYFYRDIIPEVTNISVGYYGEHAKTESIAVLWLIDNFIPAICKVPWAELPVKRDPLEEPAWQSSYGYMSKRSNNRTSFRYPTYGSFERSSSMFSSKSKELDKRFEQMIEEEDRLSAASRYGSGFSIISADDEEDKDDPISAVSNTAHLSSFGEEFGVCDCCEQEDQLEQVDSAGKYLFCELCAEKYYAALESIEDSVVEQINNVARQ